LRTADCGLLIDGVGIVDWDCGLLIAWVIASNQQSTLSINNPQSVDPQSPIRNPLST
jgi:hypothetical protein